MSNENPGTCTKKEYENHDELPACGTDATQSTEYERIDSSSPYKVEISIDTQLDNEDDKGISDNFGKMNMIGNNSILNKDINSIVPCKIESSASRNRDPRKKLSLLLLLVCAVITITVVIFGIMSAKRKHGTTASTVSATTTNNNTSGYNVYTIPPNSTNSSNTPSKSPNVRNYSPSIRNYSPSISNYPPNIPSESNHSKLEDVVTSLFINAGGEEYYDNSTNQSWLADVYYNGGNNIDIESCQEANVTTFECSYRLFRESAGGNLSYDIPIPDVIIENDTEYYSSATTTVNCNVSLYFMEDYYTQSGMRIFDVMIEDTLVIPQLDVYDVAGGTFMLYKSSPVPIMVNDSVISIKFEPIISYPLISGIEINCTYSIKTDSNNQTSESNQLIFNPGYLSVQENGLLLSQGLTAKIIAVAGKPVQHHDGTMSVELFHELPDAGATYVDPRKNNVGGWIYVSNSEVRPKDGYGQKAGVGAITFDSNGNIIHYQKILNETTSNCGGGKTPWGSWISCEEYALGEIYQVDPSGIRPSEKITMGSVNPGRFESFAYDVRNQTNPHFFVTKDHELGELTRFTPESINWTDPWSMLQGPGTVDYLVIDPVSEDHGTYSWTTDFSLARSNAREHFPNCEGIDAYENELYFISKIQNMMYILDLDSNNYTRYSTLEGLFAGQPDQIVRLTGNTTSIDDEGLLYFTEDGGSVAGVHARNRYGQYFTILESREYADETTGLSFSPNGIHLYIAYQDNGILFDVTRIDGLPFSANTLNVKYHKT